MALASGARLGVYEVVGALGAGGMGEVYRARDTKLGRTVALKVLPDDVAADPERIVRFEREAKALAALNHPRIAALYGMDAAGDRHFLVMELVEGETLAERLERGPLPLADGLSVMVQIAEALEAAHEKGIVHRDLKPANVKITPDGAVKVLDFGLAKAIETEPAVVDLTRSPTQGILATRPGVILGTAAYMSPEQAKGLPTDPRSDVFAFGIICYEVLTGRRPFSGDTAADLLASLLVRDPDLSALPPQVNPRLADLVSRCLKKPLKERWQAIGDVRAELETVAADPHGAAVARPARRLPLWRRALPIVAAAAAASAVTAIVAWSLMRPASPPIWRFAVRLPDPQLFTNSGRQLVAISPDGANIVYVANQQLYVRPISSVDATPIPGTHNALGVVNPVFSPDGQWIAFWSGGEQSLKRIPLAGGAANTICTAERPYGVAWGRSGILFGDATKGILRVSPNGGEPEVVARIAPGEVADGAQFLPGEDWFLFTLASASGVDRWTHAKIVAQSLRTGDRRIVLDDASDGHYVASGHLVYATGGVLQARAFDLRRLEARGGAVSIVEGIRRSDGNQTGTAHFSVSDTGTLIYIPGPAFSSSVPPGQLGFVDERGAIDRLNVPPAAFDGPRVSPDGRRLAVGVDEGRTANIWIYDLSGSTSPRQLTITGHNRLPVWTADGQRIVFQSDRDGDVALFSQRADGSDTARRLTTPEKGDTHAAESDSRAALAFSVTSGLRHSLWTWSWIDGKAAPFGDIHNVFPTNAAWSPDGRWLAYTQVGEGVSGIWIEPYPATGVRHLIARVGIHPLWSRDGRALFHSAPGGQLTKIPIATSPTFQVGVPVPLPVARQPAGASAPRNFDAAADGRLLCVLQSSGDTPGNEIRVVLNWFRDLSERVPTR